jgi:hypothetical protein
VGETKTIEGVEVARLDAKRWRFRYSGGRPDFERLKAIYQGRKPAARADRHAGRSRRPFDAATLADVRARAAEFQPLPAPPARSPDWGAPLTWRDVDEKNCLRIAISMAFGLPLHRVPPRPTNPDDRWADEFENTLRHGGLDLELVPARELEIGRGERWVALIDGHAVAMIGRRQVLYDSAKRWARGEQLDVPLIAGYVRRRVKTDRWGSRA